MGLCRLAYQLSTAKFRSQYRNCLLSFQGHKMGPLEEDYIETVLTCEGDFYDPEFHTQLQDFSNRLQDLITTEGMPKVLSNTFSQIL